MQRAAHGSFGDRAAVPPQEAVARTAYSSPPSPHDWAKIKGTIHEYYVLQNQPLHSVRELLKKNHGFKASERMIKARLAKWEYIKNAKREDWGYLAILHDNRRKERKPTVFEIRGHRKTVRDLQRFIRNQNITLERFLAESHENIRDTGKQIPDYIRAHTPDTEDPLNSPSAETSLSGIRSPSPLPLVTGLVQVVSPEQRPETCPNPDEFLCYHDPAKSGRDNFEHECPYKSYATEPDRLSIVRTAQSDMSSSQSTPKQGRRSLQVCSCNSWEKTRLELEACSAQLLKPVPLKSRIGHNDMRCWTIISNCSKKGAMELTEQNACSRCNQPSTVHFPSLDLFEPRQGQRNILNDTSDHTLHLPTSTRDEGSWVWVSLCFLACMSLRRGDEAVANSVLAQAANKFETLLRARDPLLLTAAGLMIAILHCHDQDKISERILQCAKDVVDRILPEGDPVRITISYLAASANSKPSKDNRSKLAEFPSTRLKQVYLKLKTTCTERHPYTIAAHHNYAWMLKHEGSISRAERHARMVHEESMARFENMHMQTITSLSVVAGCLALQEGRENECIDLYRTMIKDATQILGVIHPYTLEAQRRLADKLYKSGQKSTALSLSRAILFGRATMLGRSHAFTEGQRKDYTAMLKELNRWTDCHGNPTNEQKELQELFEKDPESAWELVSRIDDDVCMTDDPDSGMVSGENAQETQWCQDATTKAFSRSASPTSSNEYEAY